MVFTRKKGGGNRFIFVVIIMILIVVYMFRLTSPRKETVYPDIVRYKELKYQYTETVKGSPFRFVRKKPTSEEGFIVLSRRGTDVLKEIYIYEGYRKYRRYVVLKE
ncbi:MAG TPA: hypothetical protein VEG39_10035 [Clostridia bacterium]|nr:hypothetical protein [Clostridia bacterium]